MTDAGDWSLRVLPVEQAPLLTGPAEGTGSVVFRYDGPPMLLTLRRTSSDDGSLTAHALNHPVGKKTLIANTGGRRRPATGPVWVAEDGSCFVIVSATDRTSWRIEPQSLDAVPVLGKRIKGHGYGVVRHTGPESEMLLTHESVGLADMLIIFELDERLFPLRRVSTASGLEWLPSGYLQIRSIGKWEIENRG
ncbi:hypothetical protein ADK57_17255 [Streptomyces sp. MMG1533]|uniref:hypothetical protein n=1 Tax=Streptomyces sp. MMG1533 TaxID=1415546 RepID=UPI0006AEDB20|nr:hypothetical protein [Streptomyces sp. MMG1533]KOU67314.1 hypothetical protein ADK57_17255 [Streptomyces sp. MMG1533]